METKQNIAFIAKTLDHLNRLPHGPHAEDEKRAAKAEDEEDGE